MVLIIVNYVANKYVHKKHAEIMELNNEVKEALFFMNRSERADLVMDLINEGFCDCESTIDALELDITYTELRDKAEIEAKDEYTIMDRLEEISTDEISDYVNANMREMP